MIKLNQFAFGTALSALLILSSSHYGFAETSQNLIAQSSEIAAKKTLETVAKKTLDASIKPAILNHPRLVLKNGAYFLVMDESGFMPEGDAYGYGLYKDDTRYLSMLDMSLNGRSPVLLSASTDEGFAGRFIYGNSADPSSGAAEQQIMLKRDVVVDGGVFEKLTTTNFGNSPVDVTIAIRFASDYADMFEVRGMGRKERGRLSETILPSEAELTSSVVISYVGLDDKLMSTRLTFDQRAVKVDKERIVFKFHLNGQQSRVINMSVGTSFDAAFQADSQVTTFDTEKVKADSAYKAWRESTALVTTSNTEFDRLLERSVRDLYILRQPTPRGNCLAAGIPWFAVAFGRDQEITAMQTMMFFPTLSRDVIEVLAAYQGKQNDSFTEEKAGRIMHELRLGEMARLKEIAFTPYYGTVDGTPLWLVLVSRYFDQTGDIVFVKKHWAEIELALQYLDSESASGYLRYGGKEGAALSNQGWKDSADSVMYSDGKLAKAPIALCEPQGYLYTAWSKASEMAKAIGDYARARSLSEKAQSLKTRFNKDFRMAGKRGIALALDGDGRPCDVYSSNMGHLLASGILDDKLANECADILMSDEMFCGWGIRTLASSETAYNPMSYHNGSVWPHDNAMSIEGLCRIGRAADALRAMSGLFETSKYRPDMRLPELFCGFSDRDFDKPVWYPVSCAPQAWAAGSVFQMLAACLGLIPDASGGCLRVVKPALPSWLEYVDVKGIRVGKGICDLRFERQENGSAHCQVLSSRDLKVSVQN
jgi:glycogen debranching enzyme